MTEPIDTSSHAQHDNNPGFLKGIGMGISYLGVHIGKMLKEKPITTASNLMMMGIFGFTAIGTFVAAGAMCLAAVGGIGLGVASLVPGVVIGESLILPLFSVGFGGLMGAFVGGTLTVTTIPFFEEAAKEFGKNFREAEAQVEREQKQKNALRAEKANDLETRKQLQPAMAAAHAPLAAINLNDGFSARAPRGTTQDNTNAPPTQPAQARNTDFTTPAA